MSVLKLALSAAGVVLCGLAIIALLPQDVREVPDEQVTLEAPRLTLYPQADPEAVWTFGARRASYDPSSRETTLFEIEEGQRMVGEVLDFTLQSDLITIDNQDNLRGEQIFVHLIEDNSDLDMQAKEDRLVLINQRDGTFEVPRLEYTGEGLGSNLLENVRASFDLEQFEAGGPDTIGFSEFEARFGSD